MEILYQIINFLRILYLLYKIGCMKKIILAILIFLTMSSSFAAQESDLVRVGISPTDFSTYEYSSMSLSATNDYSVYDKNTQEEYFRGVCGVYTDFLLKDDKIIISSNGKEIKKDIKGPVGIKLKYDPNGLLTVKDLKRSGKQAFYRGEFEVGFSKSNKLSLVNVLPLEDYLKGVVPNELPVRFGLEALKAQAVAARNYTIRPRTRVYHNFDVCDSVQCQVYFGANTEHPLSNKAIEETKGLYALYNGDLILALYSSTAGGYTEDYANAFTDPGSTKLPSESIPYLAGKPDKFYDLPADLNDDYRAEKFYMSRPNSYDQDSPLYRWEKSWTKQELQDVLSKRLPKAGAFVSPGCPINSDIGELRGIRVLKRGVSGKAVSIEITTSTGKWIVSKELIIRQTLQKNNANLPSANIVFKNNYNIDGTLDTVTIYGGGFGHGVGMSQYGAGYMSSRGYSFNQILRHYYSGITIGTPPAVLSYGKSYDFDFTSPEEKALLVIVNPYLVQTLAFRFNNQDIIINSNEKYLKVDISRVVKKNNHITFLPLRDVDKAKKLKVWVEVYGEKNE